jgi:hypothetical protein
MGKSISHHQSPHRSVAALSRLGSLALMAALMLSRPTPAVAQARGTTAEFERANRVAEALRQVTLLGNSRNPGYYSDWQVKGDRIPLWSRQCLGRSLTPEEFATNQAAATSTVTCIVQDMFRQEIRSAQNDEGLAIRRIASWWVTGDPSRFNEDNIAAYTKRVLTTYQPNGLVTAAQPAPAKPVYIAPINPGIPQASVPTPQPAPIGQPIDQPNPITVPTELLPPIKPRQGAITPVQPAPTPVKPTPPQPTPAVTTPAPATPTAPAPGAAPTPIKANGTNFYDRYMQEGYTASRAKDYAKALLFFRRALDERPDDSYATTAIKNMEAQAIR